MKYEYNFQFHFILFIVKTRADVKTLDEGRSKEKEMHIFY